MLRKINPTVKAAAIMTTAIIIAFSFSIFWTLVLILFCLICMLLSHVDLKRLAVVMIPATLAAVSLTVAIYLSGAGETSVGTVGFSIKELGVMSAAEKAAAVGVRIYGYFFMGMSFALTTDNNDFVYSMMQQCKVKPKFAYGILAAFNLIPMIREEVAKIRLSYKVRGYRLTPFSMKPLFSSLVNAINWSENLAMAMESKGFEENGERTYRRTLKIRAVDLIWAFMLIGIGVCGLIFRNGFLF